MTGAPFFDVSGGGVSTADKVFLSETDGRPGFFTVTVTQDAAFDGDSYDATVIELGRYCVAFVVSE
ncbi:hypothetical protein [Luethyella okanaganae]|uniref:Uncharacterized protein n=1 Tax=Luethyella okanaganae TaxID=69372 RepID=A0ABW1VI79_9MICO